MAKVRTFIKKASLGVVSREVRRKTKLTKLQSDEMASCLINNLYTVNGCVYGIQRNGLARKRKITQYLGIGSFFKRFSAPMFAVSRFVSEICPSIPRRYIYRNERKTARICKDGNKLSRYLASKGIITWLNWTKPKCLGALDEQSELIFRHILSLPCDQRYTEEDMRRICDALEAYELANRKGTVAAES